MVKLILFLRWGPLVISAVGWRTNAAAQSWKGRALTLFITP